MDADLRTHFEVEEGLLLPSIEAVGEVELAQRVRADHARLRALCARAGADRDGLRQFGELLRQHVRFEESELFPIAERMLGVVELEAVAEASASTAAAQERARQRAQKRIGK
jgi:hemerythrin-like domain-containing protein